MTKAIIRTLLVAFLLVPIALPAQATGETFTSEWNGVPYLEDVNPLARFKHFTITDPDGDGIGNLSHPQGPIDPHIRTVDPLGYVTNADIEAEMTRLGWSRDYIVLQINMVIGGMPQYNVQRNQAISYIGLGQYTMAVPLLVGTPLDMVLWCGRPDNLARFPWVLGIPTVLRCDPGTDLVPDATAAPEVTNVVLSNGAIGSIAILGHIQGITASSTRYLIGGGYRDNHGAVVTSLQLKSITITVNVAGLTGSQLSGRAGASVVGGTFAPSDTIYYTYGRDVTLGRTIAATIKSGYNTVATFYVDFVYSDLAGDDWSVVATPNNPSAVDVSGYFETVYPYSVLLNVYGVPDWIYIKYSKFLEGPYTKHRIQLDGPNSLLFTEVQGAFRTNGYPQLSFQFAGLPSRNTITLNLGNNAHQLSSYDITKYDSSVGGRYRTIVVNGAVSNLQFDGQLTDANRVKVLMGADPWDSDGDYMAEESVNFAKAGGRLDIKAKETWYKKVEAAVSVHCFNCPTSLDYSWGPVPTCTISCSGWVPEGETAGSDSTAFNGYVWATPNSQLSPALCSRVYGGGCP